MVPRRDRILITGARGFIGAALAANRVDAGHEVHLLFRPGGDPWRLKQIERRYQRHDADLRDAPAVRRAVDAIRPDVIFHAAAQGTSYGKDDRAEILASNVLGTFHLLDALAGQDYRALVNVGSSSEYGHKNGPMLEADRLEPRNEYAVGKAAGSLLCQAEALKGRPVCTVRVFSAYGPLEEPSRLASQVMASCLRGESPRVTAGSQPRDWIFIDDVVSLLCAVAECPEARGRILHAGSGRIQTVRDMVEAVLAVATGGRVRAEFGAETRRPDEPAIWVADTMATRAITGWEPTIDLRAGVARMWSWYSAARTAA
jgi:nucleoside-diphosphate-sugar epimerase